MIAIAPMNKIFKFLGCFFIALIPAILCLGIAYAIVVHNSSMPIQTGVLAEGNAKARLILPEIQIEPTDIIVTDPLHIRTQPHITGDIIGYLSEGDEITITGCENGWAWIRIGWINARHLTENKCRP